MDARSALHSGVQPEVHEERWCQYCPAFPSCLAKTTLLRRLADGSESAELDAMLPLTPEIATVSQIEGMVTRMLTRGIPEVLAS
ncbi:MAG: hypothetical protein MJE77_17785 [Proteobacteria bacterium]|nr:hypothetical protein [Pseudomonadota bacterium]